MRNFFMLLILIGSLYSCESNYEYEQYQSINKNGWHKDSIQEFLVERTDSLAKYNLYFSVRNDNDYPFSNLWVITQIGYPNGKQIVDTLQYQMALPSGEWLGTGGLSLKENELWFKENFVFTEKGTYHISIAQAMRKNGATEGVFHLKGITDIGLKIESAEITE